MIADKSPEVPSLLPITATTPLKDLEAKGRRTADEKLSIAFLQRDQAHRTTTLDRELAAMRRDLTAED